MIDTEVEQFEWGLYNNNNKIILYRKTLPDLWYTGTFIFINGVASVILVHTLIMCFKKEN